jgi:hypothetical protein
MYTQLTPRASAALFTGMLEERKPFLHLRYGDGAMECMNGHAGGTCDGEVYSDDLAIALQDAWNTAHGPNVYIGDWLSASFTDRTFHTAYGEDYCHLVGDPSTRNWVHFEALLLQHESTELLGFYRALKQDRRKKLYLGPMPAGAKMLNAEHQMTPMVSRLHAHFLDGAPKLWNLDFDVLIYGAGMAAQPQVVECWKRYPERTYINLGSALDPLFRGKTRQQQIDPWRARSIFRELM